jgi:glutathione S-transferase
MLRIWGRATSSNVQKVMWLVGELGVPHERIDVGGRFGGLDAPAFQVMNPHGRIPVIDDHGTVVWESHSVLRYLAARHGEAGFWPESAARRSQVERWMDWSQTSLEPDFTGGVFWGFYRTPAPERDAAAIDASLRRCTAHMQLLDQWLEGKAYLQGDELSLADIPAGAMLFRYFELDIARPRVPNVEAWYGRLKARPAYAEHVMVPFGELFGRLSY